MENNLTQTYLQHLLFSDFLEQSYIGHTCHILSLNYSWNKAHFILNEIITASALIPGIFMLLVFQQHEHQVLPCDFLNFSLTQFITWTFSFGKGNKFGVSVRCSNSTVLAHAGKKRDSKCLSLQYLWRPVNLHTERKPCGCTAYH